MTVKLLTEHMMELLSLAGGCTTNLSLQFSKYHIVGIHMSQLILNTIISRIPVFVDMAYTKLLISFKYQQIVINKNQFYDRPLAVMKK